MNWRIHEKDVSVSTNLDARDGVAGDVFTAVSQTGGRGRLDHRWLSPPGANLTMSAVLSVDGIPADRAATLPLVAGLAVVEGLGDMVGPGRPEGLSLKWPNDVLLDGKKLAGILCERLGDNVIVGIGVNVNQRKFPKELENRAVSLCLSGSVPGKAGGTVPVERVRDAVLGALGRLYGEWVDGGLSPFVDRISEIDFLKGRVVSVVQTDEDDVPVTGVCDGIAEDGTLVVGGRHIWAGEAHVASVDNM